MFQIHTQLSNDVVSQLLIPLGGVLEGDLAEAEFSKKRFNKVNFVVARDFVLLLNSIRFCPTLMRSTRRLLR
jgi:hypothetical protein